MIKSFSTLTQASDSIIETIHASKLRESHAEKLVPARERARMVVAVITLDDLAEVVMRKLQDKLRK